MKAVILAAGMGTRLGTLIPKPLTSLKDEKTILDFQLEKLADKVGQHNIYVIVGYKKEIIMEKFPHMIYIYNDAYTRNNTSKSLLFALNKIDEDVLWMNGDVFFDKKVLDLICDSSESASLVDQSQCADEEIKYNLNDKGYIHDLSKQVKDGLGESVGINLIKKKDLDLFREELKKVEESDYFEKALENLTISDKLDLKPINLGDLYCKEVDFEEDLEDVRKYLSEDK